MNRLLMRLRSSEVVLPVLIGVLAFLVVVGIRPLDPMNLAWIPDGDSRQYYLSWLFYRHSPWIWPLGLNPNFGIEISSSIVFTDTNPLFAFVFKALDGMLPTTFQYFGIWLLLCFALQALFSWRLLSALGTQHGVRIFGTVLMTLAPPMLVRVAGHFNLAAHFLIIAALYFALSSENRKLTWQWPVLAAVASLVHSYLLVGVLAIWMASGLDRAIFRRASPVTLGLEAILVAIAVYACLKASGYFVVGEGVVGGGYGLYRMNMLSPFDANGWSRIPFDIPEGQGDYEGFNFFGWGGLLVIMTGTVVAAINWKAAVSPIRKHSFLLLAVVVLAVYALSNNIGIGGANFEYELPETLSRYFNIFRASGRFFWVAYYLILAASLAAISRWMPARAAIVLVAAATVAQVFDMYPRLADQRERFSGLPSSSFSAQVEDNFWNAAASHYKSIRRLPPGNQLDRWQDIAWIAGSRKLATDSVFFARINNQQLSALQARAQSHLNGMPLDPSAIYIVEPSAFSRLEQYLQSSDWVGKVNGFVVVAPGGRSIPSIRAFVRPYTELASSAQRIDEEPQSNAAQLSSVNVGAVGTQLTFGTAGSSNAALRDGWSHIEPWGVWSDGPSAVMEIPVGALSTTLQITANSLTSPSHPRQRVIVHINGSKAAQQLSLQGSQSFSLHLPANHHGKVTISFEFPDAISPAELGMGGDSRKLAIGVIKAEAH